MENYCRECGAEIDPETATCPDCGQTAYPGDTTTSYFGSALLYCFAVLAVIPTEGYDPWIASSLAFAATATLTLPRAKLYLWREHDFEMEAGLSWLISIVGTFIALSLIP